MERRRFLGLCGAFSAVAAGRQALAAPHRQEIKRFERVRLVNGDSRPIKASLIKEGLDYVFHYPFVGTPCLLADLGAPPEEGVHLQTIAGREYEALGGVGPKKSIVAFSGICTHLMTHPNKKNSFVNYHHGESDLAGRDKVITCCAHGSVFDATRGGEVMAGEAKQPLISIVLEHDQEMDELYAVGVLGDDILFKHFLTVFKRDLRWQFGRRMARRKVKGEAMIMPLAKFTKTKISC